MRGDTVAHDAAEQLAAHAEQLAATPNRPRRLSLECRGVDRALARDDEVCAGRLLAEADRLQDVVRARDELGPEPGKRRAEAARGAAAAANAAAGPASGVEPGGGCAPNAIVLSLFTSKSSYHGGQYPVFAVYAVSTASRACSFDISPARLHVQVSSSGRVIWDSADCTRGQPDRRAELRRGVPAQESLSWNRTISLPGCVTVASSARPGTYQVQARDASVASPVRTFKLAH